MKRKIRYRGHTFFRNKDGYYRNGQTTLHRFKYEEKFGTAFSCFHLHHKDRDKFNNNINNLMLLTVREHIAMHKAMRRERIFKDQPVLDFSL